MTSDIDWRTGLAFVAPIVAVALSYGVLQQQVTDLDDRVARLESQDISAQLAAINVKLDTLAARLQRLEDRP